MAPMQSQPPKRRPLVTPSDSILESLRDISGSVGQTVTHDVAGKIATDALTSIFGATPGAGTGELRPNESINLTPEAPKATPSVRHEIIKPLADADENMVRQQIAAVRQELAALAKSVAALRQDVTQAVMSEPVDPGVYHLNFYDQLRSFLKAVRLQVEDSRTWLSATSSRRKKRGFWSMYKKHGTSFGLSNERMVSTQTG